MFGALRRAIKRATDAESRANERLARAKKKLRVENTKREARKIERSRKATKKLPGWRA